MDSIFEYILTSSNLLHAIQFLLDLPNAYVTFALQGLGVPPGTVTALASAHRFGNFKAMKRILTALRQNLTTQKHYNMRLRPRQSQTQPPPSPYRSFHDSAPRSSRPQTYGRYYRSKPYWYPKKKYSRPYRPYSRYRGRKSYYTN